MKPARTLGPISELYPVAGCFSRVARLTTRRAKKLAYPEAAG